MPPFSTSDFFFFFFFIYQQVPELPLQNGCPFPSAASPVAMATIVSAVTMTTEDAVKKAMMVKLDISVSINVW